MISGKLVRQLRERLWFELTTYEIKDDNAFVPFSPRFISTAFFYDMASVFLIAYFYTELLFQTVSFEMCQHPFTCGRAL